MSEVKTLRIICKFSKGSYIFITKSVEIPESSLLFDYLGFFPVLQQQGNSKDDRRPQCHVEYDASTKSRQELS